MKGVCKMNSDGPECPIFSYLQTENLPLLGCFITVKTEPARCSILITGCSSLLYNLKLVYPLGERYQDFNEEVFHAQLPSIQ